MMNENFDHIDKFFEQKIGSSEAGPPSQGWDRLAASIEAQSTKPAMVLVSRKWLSWILIISLTSSLGIVLLSDQRALEPIAGTFETERTIQKASSSRINKEKTEIETITTRPSPSPIARHGKTEIQKENSRINETKDQRSIKAIENIIDDVVSKSDINDPRVLALQQNNTPDNHTFNRFNLIPNNGASLASNLPPLLPIMVDSFANQQYKNPFVTVVSRKVNPKKFHQNPTIWEFSVFTSLVGTLHNISTDNPEARPLLNKINNDLTIKSAKENGIRFAACNRFLYAETGLWFSEINYQESYQYDRTETQTVTSWESYSFWDINHDTIDWYCQVQGTDSLWIPIVEETQTEILDSIPYTRTDTINSTVDYLLANRYRYIEVPLIVGFKYYRGKVTILTKSGVVTNILRDVSAYSISGTNEGDIYQITKPDLPSFTFDIYAGLETRYHFANRFFVFGDLYYRKALQAYQSRHTIIRRLDSYGLKIGIGFQY